MAGVKGATGRKKDPARTARTREALLQTAYGLFTQKNIESVSMQEIADAAGYGVATLYRYYGTKPKLVVAVATLKWSEIIAQANHRPAENAPTGAQGYRIFLDAFLALYRENKDLLCFNQMFNIYIRSARADAETMQSYMQMIDTLAARFHAIYEKGTADGTMRADIPESLVFGATLHLMLSAVTRYAVGLVYRPHGETEEENELKLLRRALLCKYCTRVTEDELR